MFTGIVEELGTVITSGARLSVECRTVMSDMTEGASIAVNGVCLTAVALRPDGFSTDLAPETPGTITPAGIKIPLRIADTRFSQLAAAPPTTPITLRDIDAHG